jgi:SRSO17 transposase
MAYQMDEAAAARLEKYLTDLGGCLRDKRKRASFALYAMGLLTEGERKSAEPIASRLCGDENRVGALHDKLLHFLGQASWDDQAVRLVAARYAVEALREREPVTAWIIDDTGFLKQGKHSVGVQRQYTGSAGKVTNCQVGVSLSVATRSAHLPIDFELYLPESWTDDPARCQRAKVPEEMKFQTKLDLALKMIERAVRNDIPGDIVLADCDYGKSPLFRETVRLHGLDYGVGVYSSTKVWRLDTLGRRMAEPVTAATLAEQLGASAFRRVTWREGTKGKMSARFCFRRVKLAQDDGLAPADRDAAWLLMEWLDGETAPTKFLLTSLPRRMSHKHIVRLLHERWRTEQAYEEMKGELGLDHYEGRTFVGWHHHVSVVLCCYAFVVTERTRHFPPSARRRDPARPLALAA